MSLMTAATAGADLDGDGVDDVVLGNTQGLAGMVPGPLSGTYWLYSSDAATYGWDYEAVFGESDATVEWKGAGYPPVAVGDIDGDGHDDLAIGANLFYGPVAGDLLGSQADVTWSGITTVAKGGDLDGDGIDDVVLGTYYGDGVVYVPGSEALGLEGVNGGDIYAGAVWLVPGVALPWSSSPHESGGPRGPLSIVRSSKVCRYCRVPSRR